MFVLRTPADGLYSFLGDYHVHGLMGGEVSQLPGLDDGLEDFSMV
jgi:hypothetical protein